MIITEARTLAIKEMLPTLAEGDKQGVRFEKGTVKVPDCFHAAHRLILEGEWQSLGVSPELGGQGAPGFVGVACAEYFLGANWALFAYASMGNGTARMIDLYGTPEQKKTYIPNIVAGKWGGTMLLTESQAGSDVGALETTAKKNDDGTYTLSGNKIFITNGEHDLCENIIHPVLARIEGDPPGTKGISIFIVPKYLVNDDGSLGERNDIVCTGVEEKHGIHGSATCSMALGSKGACIGYLLGTAREGMKVMFNMINGARMSTGLQGMSYASAAYLLAVNYARERLQGRNLEDFKNHVRTFGSHHQAPGCPPQPVVDEILCRWHAKLFPLPDILCHPGALRRNRRRAGILCRSFRHAHAVHQGLPGHAGHEVCIQAIQVYGGAGYCQDYLVEQYARDCKITSIYEGTSGIQAMDMLARKLGQKEGRVFMSLLQEMHKTIALGQED